MATVKINTAYNVNINFELAGIDKRFFAWLIDAIVRFFIIFFLQKIVVYYLQDDKLYGEEAALNEVTIRILSWLPVFFYFFICETFFNGQRRGKRALKIRVASLEGYKPTATQYLTRWCFRLIDLGFISLTFLGFAGIYNSWIGMVFIIPNILAIVYLLNSKKEQRLGDVASGTVVIKLEPITQLSDTIFEEVSKEYKVIYANVLKLSDRDVTIIKNALQNYEKSGNDNTLWLIAEKLQKVLDIKEIGDPYYMLDAIIRDYNYLSAN
jgi:uncharacterized RDD family membrane protein YckC